MENSYTKYIELVDAGKIDPNEPIKRIPVYTTSEVILILEELKSVYTKFYKSESPWSWENPFPKWVESKLNKK